MHFREFEPEARRLAKANHRFLGLYDYDFLKRQENQHHLPQLMWVEDHFVSVCVGHILVFLNEASRGGCESVSTLTYVGDSGWKEDCITIFNVLKRHYFVAIAQNGWIPPLKED